MKLVVECPDCKMRYLLASGHPSRWLLARIPAQLDRVMAHDCVKPKDRIAGLVKV